MKKKTIYVGDVFFIEDGNFIYNYVETENDYLVFWYKSIKEKYASLNELFALKYLGEGYVEELSTGMKFRIITRKYNTLAENGILVKDKTVEAPSFYVRKYYDNGKYYNYYAYINTYGKSYVKRSESSNNELTYEKPLISNEFSYVFQEIDDYAKDNPITIDTKKFLDLSDENKKKYLEGSDEIRRSLLNHYIELGRKYYKESYNKAFNINDNICDIQEMAELENKLYDFGIKDKVRIKK